MVFIWLFIVVFFINIGVLVVVLTCGIAAVVCVLFCTLLELELSVIFSDGLSVVAANTLED